MNPPILSSIKQFLHDEQFETLELEFSVLNVTLTDSSFRMKNLPSKRSFWKIFAQKSLLGNVTFYFRDGPKFVFALVVDTEYLPSQNTEKKFVVEKFIVLGADPVSGTKITITEDSFRVNAKINNQGSFLTQEYKNCLAINAHKEKLAFETLTKNPEGSDNCYIATLVYKDINHPQVNILRKYRDETLSQNFYGRIFIRSYYFLAPKIIFALEPFDNVQKRIKSILDAFIQKLENEK